MSVRLQQPEPFIRGCLFPGFSDATYPRANPADLEHLSPDVWQSAQVPVGVRLEFVGDVDGVRITYETTTANLGYRGEGAGCRFAAYRSGQKIAEIEAVLGEGVVELPLSGEPNRPVIVYLPEGMRPIVTGMEGIGGIIEPAPRQPRWLCYGDAITQGWLASSPSLAWPAVAARKLGLDLCNFGYAGSARVDTTAALAIADMPTDLVSISLGANNWSRFPHTPALCAEELKAMISLVRSRHHNAPMVIVTPFLRPEAEDTHNRLGATLTDLRFAMGEAVRERIAAGDVRLYLVDGSTVIRAADLADGMYPGDDGHIRIAAAVGKMISPLMNELRNSAENRWAAEAAAALRLEMPQVPQMAQVPQMVQVAQGAQGAQPSSTGYLQAAGPEVVARMNALASSNGVAAPAPAGTAVPYQPPVVPAPAQQVPAQQVPAQQVPAQQVPAQQVPAQQVAAQQVPAQQVPAQQVPAQQVSAPPTSVSGPAPARGYESPSDQGVPQETLQETLQETPRATPALPPSPAAAAALPPQARAVPQVPFAPSPAAQQPNTQNSEFAIVAPDELALDPAEFDAAALDAAVLQLTEESRRAEQMPQTAAQSPAAPVPYVASEPTPVAADGYPEVGGEAGRDVGGEVWGEAEGEVGYGEFETYDGEMVIQETELNWETPEYESAATSPEPIVAEVSVPTNPSEWTEGAVTQETTEAVEAIKDAEEIDWSGEAIAAEESFWSEMIEGSRGSGSDDLSRIVEPETLQNAETLQNPETLQNQEAQDLPAEGSAPYPLLQAARYLERGTKGYPELDPRSVRAGEVARADSEDRDAEMDATEDEVETIGVSETREAVSQWQ